MERPSRYGDAISQKIKSDPHVPRHEKQPVWTVHRFGLVQPRHHNRHSYPPDLCQESTIWRINPKIISPHPRIRTYRTRELVHADGRPSLAASPYCVAIKTR